MTATLERGLNALREQIDAPVASFFTSCVSCGLCADSGTGPHPYAGETEFAYDGPKPPYDQLDVDKG